MEVENEKDIWEWKYIHECMYISMYVCIYITDICIHTLCAYSQLKRAKDITETIKIIFCEINIYICLKCI